MMYILTMVIALNSPYDRTAPSVTSFTQEYTSESACKIAADANRNALVKGSVILASCTKK